MVRIQNDSVDYPDFIHPVANDVANQKVRLRNYYMWFR